MPIVYILTNEAMPGIVKIGITESDLKERIAQLSRSTSVPLPFECYYAAEVEDMGHVENCLHQLFADQRVNHRREFFRIDPEKAVLALSIAKFPDVTPVDVVEDDEEKAALAKARRPALKLSSIGIEPGAVLTFSRDENRTAIVTDNNKVILDGEMLSPASAALKILHQKGYRTPTASGSLYWMYDGELLDDRRRRLEAQQFNA